MEPKKAFITGVSSGIGRAVALLLSTKGYSITGIGRDEQALRAVKAKLGVGHEMIETDISSEAGINSVCELIGKTHFAVLINNAGFGAYGPFEKLPLERQLAMIEVNNRAVVTLSHTFLQAAKKGDSLINIGSIAGELSYPVSPVYGATKAFIISFSESLWYTQKKRGIYVCCVNPGATNTQFHKRAGAGEFHSASGILQKPEDVAEVVWRSLRERKDPVIASGFKNILLSESKRLLPRKIKIGVMGMYNEKNPAMNTKKTDS